MVKIELQCYSSNIILNEVNDLNLLWKDDYLYTFHLYLGSDKIVHIDNLQPILDKILLLSN